MIFEGMFCGKSLRHMGSSVAEKYMFSVFSFCALLLAAFFQSFGFYLLFSILPIYLTDANASLGLGWSKGEAFSLLGSSFSVSYIAPIFGAVFSDFVFGTFWTSLMGYALIFFGIFTCLFQDSKTYLTFCLFSISIGVGVVKVCLTASLGRYFAKKNFALHTRTYDFFYMAVSLGFVVSHLFSYFLYLAKGFKAFLILSGAAMTLSVFFFVWGNRDGREIKLISYGSRSFCKGEKEMLYVWKFFLPLSLFALLFFSCAAQINTSICLFLKEEVPRFLGSYEVSPLWVSGAASLVMIMLTPFKAYIPLFKKKKDFCPEAMKMTFGFFLLSVSFFSCMLYSLCDVQKLSAIASIFFMFLFHLGVFLADSYIRPELWSAAKSYFPRRYCALAMSCVYLSIAFGMKLGSMAASNVEWIGYRNFFALFFLLSVFCVFGVFFIGFSQRKA